MEYIIPLLGYTIWISALVMFILFSVEAIVGASFWAFSHIRADGEELVNQHQSYGWRILPVALFYPLMMVVGLIFANVTMSAMISLVNQTFLMSTNALGSVWDPFGIAAILTVMSGIYYNIIQRSYRLITWIPEWVGSWMGSQNFGRGDGHGEGMQVFNQVDGRTDRQANAFGTFSQNMAQGRKGLGGGQQQGVGEQTSAGPETSKVPGQDG